MVWLPIFLASAAWSLISDLGSLGGISLWSPNEANQHQRPLWLVDLLSIRSAAINAFCRFINTGLHLVRSSIGDRRWRYFLSHTFQSSPKKQRNKTKYKEIEMEMEEKAAWKSIQHTKHDTMTSKKKRQSRRSLIASERERERDPIKRALKLSQFEIVVRSLYGSRFDSIREQVRIEPGQRERERETIVWSVGEIVWS